MSLFEDTNPRDLKDLLRQIDSGDCVLPDFQRDFVWDASATQELIVSIANNYPAGSLLRIRNTRSLFAFRHFEGAPANGSRPTYLVLDGQQRLTSLYQAFYGQGDYRYYINLKQLLDTGDFEDCINHFKFDSAVATQHDDFLFQAERLVLPLAVLSKGAGGFSSWMLKAARRLPNEDRNRLEDQLTQSANGGFRPSTTIGSR
jgi:hypothetical protein